MIRETSGLKAGSPVTCLAAIQSDHWNTRGHLQDPDRDKRVEAKEKGPVREERRGERRRGGEEERGEERTRIKMNMKMMIEGEERPLTPDKSLLISQIPKIQDAGAAASCTDS
ncbi:unnamed protein product [Pleuronectes platessa]|uniref:Uncharacterized protein n=1 Tax=Pleuronectes platessa TaxID=8262 RepID=A0A9N7U3A2_PLEPL|nr:unnamed protein product [Pleuronectes platessa]